MTIVMRGMALTPGTAASPAVVSAGLQVELGTGQVSLELDDPSLVANIASTTLSASIPASTLGAVYLESSQTAEIPSTTVTAEVASTYEPDIIIGDNFDEGTAYSDGVIALYVVYGVDGNWEAVKTDENGTFTTGAQTGTKPTSITQLRRLAYS